MSDKQTPKALKQFLISLNMGIDEGFDMSEINQAPELSFACMFWNARDTEINELKEEIKKYKISERDRVNRLLKYQKAIESRDAEINELKEEVKTFRKILNSFLTTEVCSQTWADEMRATIDDVLNGDKDE